MDILDVRELIGGITKYGVIVEHPSGLVVRANDSLMILLSV